ncbi:MAG: hypothetical protein QXE28_01560 [Desulfurococcaceae archaeon]
MASSRKMDKASIIIRTLEKYGECNLNTIRKETGLNYYSLVRILEELIAKGVVAEKRIGRLRLFKLVENQRKA